MNVNNNRRIRNIAKINGTLENHDVDRFVSPKKVLNAKVCNTRRSGETEDELAS